MSRREDPGPELITVRSTEEREALEALARLRPEDQEIIRLRTWEELPNEQIASILGLSVRAVESRLTRARRKLERMLATPSPRPSKVRPLPTKPGSER